MNWLGEIVAARVRPTDEVLDLGCGIMPATGGRLNAKCHVGVDCFSSYIQCVGQPGICARLPQAVAAMSEGGLFPPNSFDVVLLLDVVEHLSKPEAMELIRGAEAIARREVILFTPEGFCPQDGYAAWKMEINEAQAHLCGFEFAELTKMGYRCTRHDNETVQQAAIHSILGVKKWR